VRISKNTTNGNSLFHVADAVLMNIKKQPSMTKTL